MEQEEEGRTRRAWWRRASVHRVSIFKKAFCSSVIRCTVIMLMLLMLKLILHLFQENKSYGTFAFILCLHVAVQHTITSRTKGLLPSRYLLYWKTQIFSQLKIVLTCLLQFRGVATFLPTPPHTPPPHCCYPIYNNAYSFIFSICILYCNADAWCPDGGSIFNRESGSDSFLASDIQ